MNDLKIPKGQIHWETYIKNGQPHFIVTSNEMRTKYYLYKVEGNNTLKKIETSTTPSFYNDVQALWEE